MPDQKIPPLPIETIKLSFEEWSEKFQPILNPIDESAGYEGKMFETFGDELTFVQENDRKHPANTWTLTSSGDYDVIGDGYHYVDRMGYFITLVPCPEGESYEIVVNEPEELSDEEAMTEIVQLLSGTDWSPDTLDEIADICRRAGHEIEDTPDAD